MAKRLSEDEIGRVVATLGWERDGDELVKTVKRKDFAGAIAFLNDVAELAEERNHHPDMSISWNRVTLRLSTHSEGGLTELDAELASAIDRLDG